MEGNEGGGKLQIVGMQPAMASPGVNFEVPEEWVGSDVAVSYYGAWVLTNAGPMPIQEGGRLEEVRPDTIVLRVKEGRKLIPKARLLDIMEFSQITTV